VLSSARQRCCHYSVGWFDAHQCNQLFFSGWAHMHAPPFQCSLLAAPHRAQAGTAPWCKPACNNGEIFWNQNGKGDGALCWSGTKFRCQQCSYKTSSRRKLLAAGAHTMASTHLHACRLPLPSPHSRVRLLNPALPCSVLAPSAPPGRHHQCCQA